MSPAITGYFHDGKSSAARQAQLRLAGEGGVSLAWDDGIAHYRIDELTVSSRLGNTPRHFSLPDGGHFETGDNDAVDGLLAGRQHHRASLWLHALESRLRWVAVAVVVTVAFVWFMVQYGLPSAAKGVALRLPVAVSTDMSEQVLSGLDERFFAASQLTETTQQRLQQRFAEVVAAVDDRFRFQLLFRQGGPVLGANAFALPSGLIVMTDELVELAEHDDELVAIMVHEVGHVMHRHGLRQVLQQTAFGLVLTYLTGDASSLVGGLPVMLMQLGYSRDFEREADQYALQYMRGANIPTVHFARIMQRLEAEHGKEDRKASPYLSTHPATSERIRPFVETSAQ